MKCFKCNNHHNIIQQITLLALKKKKFLLSSSEYIQHKGNQRIPKQLLSDNNMKE